MSINRFIIEDDGLEHGSFITEGQNYLLVLLTTLQASEDLTYFSFTHLIDGKVCKKYF